MSTARRRPAAHFTSRAGWINDPYGVHWDGTQYHLYFQAIPGQVVWSPDCRWGHAVSPDLVSWQEQAIALTPQPFEAGCWSGTVVGDLALYTRVQLADLELGSVALARPDGAGGLHSAPGDVVIAPPEGAAAFRDPFVVPDGDEWAMVVGGGTADGAGSVFAYRSGDLRDWRYDGVLRSGRIEDAASRESWECPQRIEVDGRDVLIVSVQLDGRAGPVLAAVGADAAWQPAVHGQVGYASSAFHDRDGRPCLISWLRETNPVGNGWAGAHSLVSLLATDAAGRLLLTPHPDVLAAIEPAPDAAVAVAGERAWRMHVEPGESLDLALGDAGRVMSDGSQRVRIRCAGVDDELPITAPLLGVDVVRDADIVEVWAGGSYGVWRAP